MCKIIQRCNTVLDLHVLVVNRLWELDLDVCSFILSVCVSVCPFVCTFHFSLLYVNLFFFSSFSPLCSFCDSVAVGTSSWILAACHIKTQSTPATPGPLFLFCFFPAAFAVLRENSLRTFRTRRRSLSQTQDLTLTYISLGSAVRLPIVVLDKSSVVSLADLTYSL